MKTCERCRYYMASPLQEPCESCHWDGTIGQDPTNWKAPTNADRIRAMSDVELAEWIWGVACPGFPAASFGSCPEGQEKSCSECWLEWLRQEASE